MTILITAAAVNIIIAALTLVKSRNRLNVSFAVLNILLAAWNTIIIFWEQGSWMAGRINFMVISMIPPAGMFFVLSLYDIKSGRLFNSLYAILAAGCIITLYTIASFFVPVLDAWYDSFGCKMMMLSYQLSALGFTVGTLIYKYTKLTYKQEKAKIAYVVTGIVIVFAGGMLDLMLGAGLINVPLRYLGNIANIFYAVLIFLAIFRMRLFNIEVFFKNFIIYTLLAGLTAFVYSAAASFLSFDLKARTFFFFVISIIIIYYIRQFHNIIQLFVERLGGVTKAEAAFQELKRIRESREHERNKIEMMLQAVRRSMEVDTALYAREGGAFMRKWPEESDFPTRAESVTEISGILVRYEIKDGRGKAVLEKLGADVIIPAKQGGAECFVAGKKQTADISFAQDEIDVLADAASAVGVYLKTIELQKQIMDEENIKRLGLMAGQMAHEIKNPLAALWGAVQLIKGSGEEKDYIDIIKQEVKRLTAILDSWQDFSREIKLDKKRVSVYSLVDSAARLVSLQQDKARVIFEKEGNDAEIEADEDKMKQVLLNLLLNAVQALERVPGGNVKVTAVTNKDTVEIKIRDNGAGIPAEIMAKVKQPLVTSKPKGSGLGLAISDRIIKAHGGSLIIDSDGKSFTEVTVEMPVKNNQQ